jgi:hypothetical protein|tara:strand:+ start:421 stop:576 length:156 start_codon:yes stop_codon:yes gene_type:complete
MKIINRKKLILKSLKIIEHNKTTNVEIKEDREEYRERYKTIVQLMMKINPR